MYPAGGEEGLQQAWGDVPGTREDPNQAQAEGAASDVGCRGCTGASEGMQGITSAITAFWISTLLAAIGAESILMLYC